ncbi:cyclase family protein [Alsobacter sp. SYSU M60028]|uniref:Cyclase family protein n=1 Tax=Alsobacter ponti TaxID=2962936 RepID=A0ABT1LDG5_9HYPH|nr:cyclase family protein [Alsobacter ponti]MCP8938765.1 cyclase family protein [Alsobacter ponti]
MNDRATDGERPLSELNWGRWGEGDERGAANLLTPEVVKEAVGLVRDGRVFSLALPIGEADAPVLPGRPACQHYMRIDGGDYAAGLSRRTGFQSVDDVVMLPTHGTTHMDALAHIADEHRLFNGFPLSGVRSNGAARLGIDKTPPLVGPGVMLDVCALRGVESLGPGDVITPADIEACEQRQGVRVRPGSIVLFRTGWLSRFASEGVSAFKSEAGIGMAAAQWLAERDVAAVGADNFAVEVIPTESGKAAPVHRALIRGCGIYLMELFNLEELREAGVGEFLFVAAPLRIVGGVGSPLNPIAIT